MARTQAADFDQRREAIIDQAAILFAERGYQGTSIGDLAKACNVSKSLIYHYYDSKEDILIEAMNSHIEDLIGTAKAVVGAGGRPDHQLRSLARNFMALYVDAAPRHKVLLNELDLLPQSGRDRIIALQRELIAIVDGIMLALTPDLARIDGAVRVKTMLFFGMINWTHTWFDPSGPMNAEQVADMACDLVLG